MRLWSWVIVVGCGGKPLPIPEDPQPVQSSATLADVAEFESIEDRQERSVALFGEMSKVLLHPRCANCHPDDDRPRQGMQQVIHEPPVWRGPDDHGVTGMHCDSCHQTENQPYARIPGALHWGLAPIEMAWINKTPGQICVQIKDPARNGGKSMEELYTHMAEDALVAWAWEPGSRREPAPGTQEHLAQLTRAWMNTGAHCPPENP